MRTLNLDLDMITGRVLAIGKDGRRYTIEELDAAERAARAGDPAARATLDAVDHGMGGPLTREAAEALLAKTMHDCPECQAARARGETVTWSLLPGSVPRGTRSRGNRRRRGRR